MASIMHVATQTVCTAITGWFGTAITGIPRHEKAKLLQSDLKFVTLFGVIIACCTNATVSYNGQTCQTVPTFALST